MRLQVEGPGVRWGRQEVHRSGVLRISDIDDGDSVAEHMADVGMALVDHDLYTIPPAPLIRMTEEIDISPWNIHVCLAHLSNSFVAFWPDLKYFNVVRFCLYPLLSISSNGFLASLDLLSWKGGVGVLVTAILA